MKAYVYVIQAGLCGPVKIGWAVDPVLRLRGFQTSHFLELRLIASQQFSSRSLAQAVEADLHKEFSKYRIRGEWFRPEGELEQMLFKVSTGETLSYFTELNRQVESIGDIAYQIRGVQ